MRIQGLVRGSTKGGYWLTELKEEATYPYKGSHPNISTNYIKQSAATLHINQSHPTNHHPIEGNVT